MQTLSYGYKKPQNPDTGDQWFPALEADIQQLNDHNHDGVTSAPLSAQTLSLLAANWVATANGLYRQSVTLPTNYQYDSTDIWVRTATGEAVYPTVEKIDSTHFYIYTNDNTSAYKILVR